MRLRGTEGTAEGTAITAAEAVPVPPAFVPATVKVYETPLASPTT